MRRAPMIVRLALVVALLGLPYRPATAADDPEKFSADRIEQMVAPIALYPDPLLMNILMASTYPLEVVEADRWLQSNKDVRGAGLDKAMESQKWDESVKSLTRTPDVLNRMSKNLDWTSDLGDAFLAQQNEVLDAVQHMRQEAKKAGNLETTPQQKVIVEKNIIQIEPASPTVIYVPVYSAPAVYGPYWSYPTYYYPPMYAYPPGYVATASLISFGVGMAVGAAVWGGCGWGNHNVYVNGGWGGGNYNNNVTINNNFNRTNINNQKWQHNAEHRRGVDYRNDQVRQRYEGAGGRGGTTRDQARAQARGFDRGTTGDRAGSQNRGGAGRDGGGAQSRQANAGRGTQDRQRDANRGTQNRQRDASRSNPSGRPNAFGGSDRSGSFERAASGRGADSRASSGGGGGANRSSGGANRASSSGGARGGGGGGGRGGGGGGGRRR
jgi:hypothetical protein